MSRIAISYIYECRGIYIGEVHDFENTDFINEKLRVLHLYPKSYQPRLC